MCDHASALTRAALRAAPTSSDLALAPLALALLVARVLADHHDAAVATDHLALVTDRLDARVDLHEEAFLVTRSADPSGPTGLLVPVDDATTGQVVRRELHHDPVLREDPDVVLTHLAADVGEDL